MPDRSFLGWPFFEERHRALAADIEHLSAMSDSPTGHADVDATCRRLVRRLADAGLLRHCVPAAYGGASERLDVRTLCLVRETLARGDALADFAFAMQGLGSGPISLFGSEEQRRTYLPAVAEGRRIAAFALSEAAAGSDVAALATTARPDGDGFVLNGAKTWISNGGIADFYVVFARTGEGPGGKGLSAFIVDADAPGLAVAERIALIAPHPLATLRFENCRVPRARLLGEPGQGFRIAMATLDVFRPTVGAAALGLARRALDETLARAVGRQLFGGALADLQMV
jgi:acyl-CoA dehydrogenase